MAFEIPFNLNSEKLLEIVKEKLSVKGGTLQGDTSKGTIQINHPLSVKVGYQIFDKVVKISILDKPFFVSESMIETELVKALGKLE